MQFQVKAEAELGIVAASMLPLLLEYRVALFLGEMGAGKTTLMRAICAALGVIDEVSSPTYGLVNDYHFTDATGREEIIHHLDLYRIDSLDELLEAGIEEVFYDDSIVLVEWPQVAEPVLPEKYLQIRLSIGPDGERNIVVLPQIREKTAGHDC